MESCRCQLVEWLVMGMCGGAAGGDQRLVASMARKGLAQQCW